MLPNIFKTLALPVTLSLALSGCATLPVQADAPLVEVQGTVMAADPRATDAGMEMLRQGGSATDAAIAVMLALTVVEPQSSGIGGGGFMVHGEADGSVTTLDGREAAPAAADESWFLGPDGQPQGFGNVVKTGLSIGVPGNVALAAQAHERYGKLPWAKLFEPAIALAEGFIVNPRLNASLDGSIERAGLDPAMRATFYQPDGSPMPVGTTIRRPELAETFRKLAADGPQAFYGADNAQALAKTIAAATPGNATMTAADITGYEPVERPASCGTYRAYRICTMGPPSSGISMLAMLGQLERFDIAALGPQSVQFWHLFLESQKLAYADRELYIGDPSFVEVPAGPLIDPAYIASRSALIDPARTLPDYPAGSPDGVSLALADGDEPVESGTTHFVAVDGSGEMVSYTSTVEGGFGSGHAFGGYHLNNELTDFSFSPQVDGRPVANRVEGGKRPRSSMTPTIVWDPEGKPFLLIGGAGGGFIPVQTARTIIGVVDFGLPLEQAMGLPLTISFGRGLYVEEGSWLAGQVDALEARGHANIRLGPQPFGSVGQVGAVRQGDGWIAAHDPRFAGKLDAP